MLGGHRELLNLPMQGRSPSIARSPALGFARGPLHGSALRALPCRVPVLNPNAGSLQLRDPMGRSDPNPMGRSTLNPKTLKP